MTPKELRSRRLAIGISMGELAFEARLPIRTVQAIETGDREVPNADLFLRVLDRLERGYVVPRSMDGSDS